MTNIMARDGNLSCFHRLDCRISYTVEFRPLFCVLNTSSTSAIYRSSKVLNRPTSGPITDRLSQTRESINPSQHNAPLRALRPARDSPIAIQSEPESTHQTTSRRIHTSSQKHQVLIPRYDLPKRRKISETIERTAFRR